jgi:poly-gamma-glutamate synthesis protein (capsule biosynthesis protein)
MRLRPALPLLLLCAACLPAGAAILPSVPETTAERGPAASTPLREPSPTPQPQITLIFTGDINPARCVYAATKAANDMALPYRPLADLLHSADITIGSLDAAISDYNPPVPCAETRNLLAPAEAAAGLEFAGFDVLTVAVNHLKDCGLVRGCENQSMFETLANLRAAGIQPVGAGANLAQAAAPVFVTVQGVRFAFLGFSAIEPLDFATETSGGTAPFKEEIYLEAIRQARAQADVVVVLPHWGTEYSGRLAWHQINAAPKMIAAGAALIVGNHPHHVQGIEQFPNGAVVAYALGNFVFDQEWSDGRQFPLQGLLLKVVLRGSRLESFEPIPVHIYDNFQPRLAPPDEAAQILQDVSDSLAGMPRR